MGKNRDMMRQARQDLEDFLVHGAIAFVVGVNEIVDETVPRDTGELAGSTRVTVNDFSHEESTGPYRSLSRTEIRQAVQLGGFAPGDILWYTLIAGHALIIEGGRRMGSHGRMLGSEQAPDGFLWPAVDTQISRMDRWSP